MDNKVKVKIQNSKNVLINEEDIQNFLSNPRHKPNTWEWRICPICGKNFYARKKYGYTKPNYFYMDKKAYLKRLNRLNFTKQKLVKMGYDSSKTEMELMFEHGYDRIWDCGSMRFIFLPH